MNRSASDVPQYSATTPSRNFLHISALTGQITLVVATNSCTPPYRRHFGRFQGRRSTAWGHQDYRWISTTIQVLEVVLAFARTSHCGAGTTAQRPLLYRATLKGATRMMQNSGDTLESDHKGDIDCIRIGGLRSSVPDRLLPQSQSVTLQCFSLRDASIRCKHK
jgi:hypothetical protein